MSEWRKVRLVDIASNIQTGPFGSQLHQSDYSELGTPVVMPKDLVNGHISEQAIARVSNRHTERLKKHKIIPGDIIYSRRGDVGRCAFAFDNNAGWLCGTGCLLVRIDTNKAIPKFVFYELQLNESIGWVVNHAIGSTMLNLNTTILSNVPVRITNLKTQDKICDILSTYDDLIENNNRQIKLLEEAAQRLYKEWFVDLHFPGYENCEIVDGVPEGWRRYSLENVIEFNPKMSFKKDSKKISVPMAALNTSCMVLDKTHFVQTTSNSGSKFKNGDTLLARITPCLENGKTGFAYGLPEEGAVGSTEFIVMRSKLLNPYMVYLFARTDSFRRYAINSMTGSDGRQRAQVDKLRQLCYILPEKNIIESFGMTVEPLFKEIYVLQNQSSRATEARDRLLPKLMSGEIEV